MMTLRESAFVHCAFMILNDQCPPDRRHYRCMNEEDTAVGCDCSHCWNDYLWGLMMGTIQPETVTAKEAKV